MSVRRLLCIAIMLSMLLLTAAAGETATDFQKLTEKAGVTSEDAKAWLEIPGTEVSYPVMQHADDAAYYLNHDALGKESVGGALYTEAVYNAADFSDPVIVIYGNRMSDGTMFGSLQQIYSGSFDEYRRILLQLPGETREYTVFAAVPYSGRHILYYNNFQSQRAYRNFFDDVFGTRKLGMHLDENLRPNPGDHVLILSTGMKGDDSQRYLVMAVLNQAVNQ